MQEIKRVVNYKDFEIYKLGKELAIKVHRITLNALPKFEMYEEGSQIRRSSKSIVSNLIEGFGRRRYKNEFIKFFSAIGVRFLDFLLHYRSALGSISEHVKVLLHPIFLILTKIDQFLPSNGKELVVLAVK